MPRGGWGTNAVTYNAALQPDAEVINGSGAGLYDKVIQRTYESGGIPGRYTGFTVGPDVTPPAADYTAAYEYDAATGRFSGITGTALPPGGVQYAYLLDNAATPKQTILIERLEYKADASTVLATTTRGYEPGRDLLTSVENRWGASVISKYDYLSDNLGQRSSVVYSGSAFAGGAGDHFDLYGYNDRNELTGSTGYFGSNPADLSQPTQMNRGYAYDPIGNRTSYDPPGQTVSQSYASNALNQYETVSTTVPIETFVYDADGNMTQDGSFAYGWDAANRLATVAPAASPEADDQLLTFTYDYRGRRVRKVVQTWDPAINAPAGGWTATPTEDRRFVYDGWNLLLELDGLNGNMALRKYAWGLDLSGTTQGAGGIGGLLAVEDTAGTPVTSDDAQYLYFYDGNGNVGQLIDLSAGTLAAHYEYDPYGNITASTGSYADTNPFRFSTKYVDAETSLSYFGYRFYSSRLGRWLSRDTIGEIAGSNLYQFVNNDPASWIDPDGRQPQSTSQPAPSNPQQVCQAAISNFKSSTWYKDAKKYARATKCPLPNITCKTCRRSTTNPSTQPTTSPAPTFPVGVYNDATNELTLCINASMPGGGAPTIGVFETILFHEGYHWFQNCSKYRSVKGLDPNKKAHCCSNQAAIEADAYFNSNYRGEKNLQTRCQKALVGCAGSSARACGGNTSNSTNECKKVLNAHHGCHL